MFSTWKNNFLQILNHSVATDVDTEPGWATTLTAHGAREGAGDRSSQSRHPEAFRGLPHRTQRCPLVS